MREKLVDGLQDELHKRSLSVFGALCSEFTVLVVVVYVSP